MHFIVPIKITSLWSVKLYCPGLEISVCASFSISQKIALKMARLSEESFCTDYLYFLILESLIQQNLIFRSIAIIISEVGSLRRPLRILWGILLWLISVTRSLSPFSLQSQRYWSSEWVNYFSSLLVEDVSFSFTLPSVSFQWGNQC